MSRQSVVKKFQEVLGSENVFHEEADLLTYSYDSAPTEQVMPDYVLRPVDSESLGKAVALCNENSLPITVRGAGSNLSGGTVPDPGGVVLLTTGLNKIIELNQEDLLAVVQPGVITAQFAAEVEKAGLFYPPDPGSQAISTLGGNVAENAGGLRGLKYGVTIDYVMAMDFFDTTGKLIKTGARTVKCASGYNLGGLLVGSEGTLGVYNTITLKLIPPPQDRRSMLAVFDSIHRASETVSRIIASKVVPATLEFMDNVTIRAVEDFSKVGLPVDAAAMLLIEVDGHPGQVADDAETVRRICDEMGANDLKVATDDSERDSIWAARRAALSSLAKLRPTLVLEDATVPRSKIPAMVQAVDQIAADYDLLIGTFGHAGDGNLHPTILTDKRDRKEWERVEQAIDKIFEKALDLDGTISGEHGTGTMKSKYLVQETSAATIAYSKKIKAALDPKNILNPGKVLGR